MERRNIILQNIAGYYESALSCFRRDFETLFWKSTFYYSKTHYQNAICSKQNYLYLKGLQISKLFIYIIIFSIYSSGNGLPTLLWVWHYYRLIERWIPNIYSVREYWFVIDFFRILRVRNKNSSNDKQLQFLDKMGYNIFMHTHEQQNRHA